MAFIPLTSFLCYVFETVPPFDLTDQSAVWILLSLLVASCFNLKIMVLLFSSFPKVLLKHFQFFLFFTFYFSFSKFSCMHGSSVCLQVTETALLAPPVSSCHGMGPSAPCRVRSCSLGQCWAAGCERRLELPL